MENDLVVQNLLDELFRLKKEPILNIYFTAGFPKLTDTAPILLGLQNAGVDIIEIGMPYSDPVADGPTIQASNQQALQNGMSLQILFEQLNAIKEQIKVPIVLMGYLNPVLQFGVEKFCQEAQKVGITGLILPDLPIKVYKEKYRALFAQHNLHNIFLISPQTSEERIRQIDSQSSGFIYMVSSASITGTKTSLSSIQIDYFKRINSMNLKNPRLIGFGISDRDSFTTASSYAHGAIIGSAFIKLVSGSSNIATDIPEFVNRIKS